MVGTLVLAGTLLAGGAARAEEACSPAAAAPLTATSEAATLDRLRLRLAPQPPAPKASRFEADRVMLNGIDRIAGPCALLVRGGASGRYDLDNGLQAQFMDGAIHLTPSGQRDAVPAPPPWLGATFVAAARVGYAPGGKAQYMVGIWRVGEEWIVATFTSGVDALPRTLARSALPLVGIGYFSSPDAPLGGLDLIQHEDATVRVIRLAWWHPHAFRSAAARSR